MGAELTTSVGEILRTARESQERTIAEVVEELCITQRNVISIEQDEIANLPCFFFYKSFTRQYAAFLGVDENLLEPGLSPITASQESSPAREAKAPESWQQAPIRALDPLVEDTNRRYFSDHRLGWSVFWLIVVVLLCSGIYELWSRIPQLGVVAAATPAQALSATAPIPQPVATARPLFQPKTLAVPVDAAATSQSSGGDVSASTHGPDRVPGD